MQTANLARARQRPSDPPRAKSDGEIDLDRIIYDPVYREKVRDELNRAKAASRRDESK